MTRAPGKAIVVGSAGQDGRLLSELLAGQGVEVIGITRQSLDVGDAEAVAGLMAQHRPDRIFYLPAVHGSSESREMAETEAETAARSFRVHVVGLVNFLHEIRRQGVHARLFYAASSRVFGAPEAPVQDESTPIAPSEPYGITKAAGIFYCRMFRQHYAVHAAAGILYNHESPMRPPGYVTQKLARAAAAAARGSSPTVAVRDLEARVDWGWAGDYVEAMRRILELPQADDFVIATGRTHSVGEFARACFAHVGLDWREHVREERELAVTLRPQLCGSPRRLMAATGWRPTVPLEEIAARMVDAQVARWRSGSEAP